MITQQLDLLADADPVTQRAAWAALFERVETTDVSGVPVLGWRCPECGGVEINAFWLSNVHGLDPIVPCFDDPDEPWCRRLAYPSHNLADFIGDNRDQRSYVRWLSLILAECLRMSRAGAHCLVFTDWRQLPATSDALQLAGWTWQGTLPWYKPINRPRRGGFRAACEYILWGSNGPYDNQREIYLPGMFSASQPGGRQRRHITQKPVDGLLSQLVQICPEGGTVLDPFAGSGSTGEAALTSDRSFVGIELSAHYHQVANERLAAIAQTPVG